MKQQVQLVVNDSNVIASVEPRTHLGDFLREQQQLTGTHLGCEHGVCGACTVLLEGKPVRSCITFAVACQDQAVHTVEGVQEHPVIVDLKTAFSRHHALQCGYCTPGMLLTALDIVLRLPSADEARIREELGGNLCRCTGYAGIVAAIQEVQTRFPEGGPPLVAVGAPLIEASDDTPAKEPIAHPPSQVDLGVQGSSSTHEAGTSLRQQISIGAPIDRVWATLRDVETVAICLPGAELTGPVSADRIPFQYRVKLGPMQAAFAGSATVDYDDAARRGRVDGRGDDRGTQSQVRGSVEFAVTADNAASTRLDLSINYHLTGRLAQFSRGGIVTNVVEQVLAQFADQLSAAATGRPIADSKALGGVALLGRAIRGWLRARLGKR